MATSNNYIGTNAPGVIQFENANEGRSYPFEDDASLVSKDGKRLPENIITDLHLALPYWFAKHYDDTELNIYLTTLYLSPRMISACINAIKKSWGTTTESTALSITVQREEFVPYMPYRLERLTGKDAYENSGGVITFGDVDFDRDAGTYRFDPEATKIVDSTILRYKPAGVYSFIDDRTGEQVRGDVDFEFPDHVAVTRDGRDITLTLKSGSAEQLASSCLKNISVNMCGATPITSINGVEADSQGRIVLWFH